LRRIYASHDDFSVTKDNQPQNAEEVNRQYFNGVLCVSASRRDDFFSSGFRLIAALLRLAFLCIFVAENRRTLRRFYERGVQKGAFQEEQASLAHR